MNNRETQIQIFLKSMEAYAANTQPQPVFKPVFIFLFRTFNKWRKIMANKWIQKAIKKLNK